ncbi:hypothetical protein [Oceanisphaera avium]|uniref:Uncharacterized protein n=1 Tax=Oceanisphaera avium TaxID=1903694 RepID=A0A1Y0CYS5_9GAMM|nr:hypothetical protein [Oceanisphaera avium]ART80057.1 hypothetical protein CBP12_07785 [Oceanisphaera avium]
MLTFSDGSMSYLRAERGFSLPELLLAILGTSVVMAAGLSLLVAVLSANNTNIELSRLHQDLHMVMDTLSRDIQRAGYHPSAAKERALSQLDPHSWARLLTFLPDEDLHPHLQSAQCLRLKFWDKEAHPSARVLGRVYYFDALNQSIKLKVLDENALSVELSRVCRGGNQLIPRQDVLITQLAFRLSPNNQVLGVRSLILSLSGVSARQPQLSYHLQRQVLLRNQASL